MSFSEREFVASPVALLALTQAQGASDQSGHGAFTYEVNIGTILSDYSQQMRMLRITIFLLTGFDKWLTPLGLPGSALFGGGAFSPETSHIEVALSNDLDPDRFAALLWIKPKTVDGKKILIVSLEQENVMKNYNMKTMMI